MAKFMKANPQQARLKISMYGPPGSGKTFTTLLMAEGLASVGKKRIAYVDTERGTDFYAKEVKERKIHPAAFDFDAIYTRSIADVTNSINALDPKEHGVIVLDSISHLWDSAMDAYNGRKTKLDGIPMQAWGKIKRPYKELIARLIASPFHVFILGRQKNIFEDDPETEQMKKVGVGMRAEGETAYEPHMCLRMEARSNPENSTQSNYLCHVEKDRTGVLAGRVIKNPGFASIEGLLPLLGETQAPLEDEDERAAKDAELMDQHEEKNKAKEGKSIGLFSTLQANLAQCTSLVQLASFAEEMKKQKRYMTDDHLDILRELYGHRRGQLVEAEAPQL